METWERAAATQLAHQYVIDPDDTVRVGSDKGFNDMTCYITVDSIEGAGAALNLVKNRMDEIRKRILGNLREDFL